MEETIKQFLVIVNKSEANIAKKPRVFIGSSTEGLTIARKLQSSLSDDFLVEIWNQGTVFGLGTHTLEALEKAVQTYDFGVFVFTPDDELHTRGETKPVARDNVIFELGLFNGRIGRTRTFIVKPRGTSISIPTDLAGVTIATYDPENRNLASALEPTCDRIRDAVIAANKRLHRITRESDTP
jgi:predicted nucleotide-binding protein